MLNSSNQKWVQLKNGLLYQKFTEILYEVIILEAIDQTFYVGK